MKNNQNRINELNELQAKLGLKFNSLELLDTALTHRSYINEADAEIKHITRDWNFLEMLF
jgi:dsRNA-specific ribonuclease